jgi:t-SNARE complex subunit (syntaxin)
MQAQQENREDEFVMTIPSSTDSRSDELANFHRQIEDISNAIEYLKSSVNEVSKIHSTILSNPKTEEKTKLKLEDLMAEIKTTATKVRQRLKQMETELLSYTGEGTNTAEYRIKKTQHSMLEHKIVDVMVEYNRIQNDYKDKCKNRIIRQLEITGRTTTNDELEEMLEKENPAVFTQGIVMDSQQLRQTLSDIEARHADIKALEKSIRELHELFVDMATLIEQQGDKVDRIENHVMNATSYVDKGREQVKQAVVYQSKARTVSLPLHGIFRITVAV